MKCNCVSSLCSILGWKTSIVVFVAFSALLAICAGNSPRSPVNSPHKGHWRGALIFSLICTWIEDWVNNREAGNLRCHRAHYEVIVMQREIDCYSVLAWQKEISAVFQRPLTILNTQFGSLKISNVNNMMLRSLKKAFIWGLLLKCMFSRMQSRISLWIIGAWYPSASCRHRV